MPFTNTPTAQAATRTVPLFDRPLTLLGLFTDATGARALIRRNTGARLMLSQGQPTEDLTLTEVGDGWALVTQGRTRHRLVIA